MQLINASVYSERAQARQTEIAETQERIARERQQNRDRQERQMLYTFLKSKGRGNQVSVLGNLFRVTAQGNKLEKVQGIKLPLPLPSRLCIWMVLGLSPSLNVWGNLLIVDNGVTTPRRIKVGGVAFHRSKNGNYWRRRALIQKSAHFPLLGKSNPRPEKSDKLCRFFTKTGIAMTPVPPFHFVSSLLLRVFVCLCYNL